MASSSAATSPTDAGAPAGADLIAAVDRRLTLGARLANGLGAVDAFLFLVFLVPISGGSPDSASTVIALNAVGGALYLAVTLWLGTRWSRGLYAERTAWLRDGRPATPEERDAILRHPATAARISITMWGCAALAFSALNVFLIPASTLAIAFVTLVLAGMTTAAVTYLLAERNIRPLTERALAGGPPPRPAALGVSARLLVAWTLATGVPVLGIVAVAVAQLAGSAEGGTAPGATLFLAVLALGVGLLAIVLAARSVAEPLAAVRGALSRVEAGDYGARVAVADGSEVGLLEAGFNRMAAGLEERERLRDLFGRHVGEDVARAAMEREVRLGGAEREIAALFVDLVGSTALAARRPPGEVVELLNRFFRAVVETVEAHGGLVNKFQGDAALCVFGAPVERPQPAADALAAARRLRARLESEVPGVGFGIGVSAGTAVAGNVGSERRYEYTVIGDPVNEAARLCDLAKQRPERLLASEAAVREAGVPEAGEWEVGEPVVLRGRDAATRLATAVAQV